jgi:hypothetical protein
MKIATGRSVAVDPLLQDRTFVSCEGKSWQWFGEYVGHHPLYGWVPQHDCPHFHVVLKEEPLQFDMLGRLADQCILTVVL